MNTNEVNTNNVNIKEKLALIRDKYVIRHIEHVKLPEFTEDEVKRYKIIFKGKVQKVGFRVQMQKMAERLELTGYCKNLENGDVYAEVQGEENKILYLMRFMCRLQRIHIKDKKAKHIQVKKGEEGFEKR